MITEMRSWLAECVWADMDEEDFAELPDWRVIWGVQKHYYGGILQFVRDFS